MHGRERIGDLDVAFDDQGAGPAVVMLPPFPFDGRAWGPTIPAVIDSGHRVLTVDYPGFGDSPPPPGTLSIARLASLVVDLMEHLAIERAAIVGLSMGGYVALALARAFPERMWALVLADTRAAADSPAAREGRAQALRTIDDQGVDGYLRASLPRLLAADAPAGQLAEIFALAEKREQTLKAGIAALRDRPDRTADLSAIACPTLVIGGAGDQVTPPTEMREMAAAIPGGRFIELAGVGHLSNIEGPREFNAALGDFLRTARAGAASSAGARGSR